LTNNKTCVKFNTWKTYMNINIIEEMFREHTEEEDEEEFFNQK
jgi:hypothetical protein